MATSEVIGAPHEAEDAITAALRTAMHGEVINRAHAAYDNARRVWNGLIDRYPVVIARCADTADVVRAIRVARAYRPAAHWCSTLRRGRAGAARLAGPHNAAPEHHRP